MDRRLQEILNDQEANYLLPFFWQHGESHEALVAEIAQIQKSGAQAFCVESRPHKEFCKAGWWADMDVILAEAAKRNMRVWILDDKHFPTGSANGLLAERYRERRQWHLREDHVDVLGPQADSSVILNAPVPEEELVAVYAYPRTEHDEVMENDPIDLTGKVRDGVLYWDIPAGLHRVFFIYKTRLGGFSQDYIHMIDKDSVQVLIEAVYESHYAHYKQYFGNTLAGFFSDEPRFGNDFLNWSGAVNGYYDRQVGEPGLALPWNEEVLARMGAELGREARSLLPALWYGMGEITPQVRVAYMNAVTQLWREAFSYQVGDWCRAHGVEYIGHIIEDGNSHSRLGHSGGHFFRSLDGQDMAGIDVVLHQIVPGMGHHIHSVMAAGGIADPAFFDYALAKLGASHAHLQPLKKGRAMCEIFGAYGWAEGTPMMKAIMDHMLVRGINYFIPHAFSPTFPDPDCPPHFAAAGQNPQFDAFSDLMRYTNKVSHLFGDSIHVANAAILYHAEAEWSGRPYQLLQEPAMQLYDRQIDFDIVPVDFLDEASVSGEKLCIHHERFDCLVVPCAAWLPAHAIACLAKLQMAGLPILFINGRPEGVAFGEIVALEDLAASMVARGFTDVRLATSSPMLRVYHAVRGPTHLFLFNNESVTEAVDTLVTVPCTGRYARLDLLLGRKASASTMDGTFPLRLAPTQSTIMVFEEALPDWNDFTPCGDPVELRLTYKISRASYRNLDCFEPVCTTSRLWNMTGLEGDPHFAGTMKYETVFDLPAGVDQAVLDLGVVGQTARVVLNGVDLGQRICQPYVFDARTALRQRGNILEVVVANTLVHPLRDPFSHYLQIPPSGLMGPVRLIPVRD